MKWTFGIRSPLLSSLSFCASPRLAPRTRTLDTISAISPGEPTNQPYPHNPKECFNSLQSFPPNLHFSYFFFGARDKDRPFGPNIHLRIVPIYSKSVSHVRSRVGLKPLPASSRGYGECLAFNRYILVHSVIYPEFALIFNTLGRAAETMGDLERAQKAYERVLSMNPLSWRALTQAAHVCRCREDYPRVSVMSSTQ